MNLEALQVQHPKGASFAYIHCWLFEEHFQME
jgi:hypothetical protein